MAYEPTNWVTGDVITAAKLNHMEDGIAGANGSLVLETTPITQNNFNAVVTMEGTEQLIPSGFTSVLAERSPSQCVYLNHEGVYVNMTMIGTGSAKPAEERLAEHTVGSQTVCWFVADSDGNNTVVFPSDVEIVATRSSDTE